jgi:hypothetical protein
MWFPTRPEKKDMKFFFPTLSDLAEPIAALFLEVFDNKLKAI